METTLDRLTNPLADLDLIPPEMQSVVYKMPDIIEDVPDFPISGMEPEPCAETAGPRTLDDIRYDVIMSWMHNNDIIGW